MAKAPDIETSFENALRAFLREQRQPADGCPDSATVAAYYERSLGEDEASGVDEHFAACVDCQAELALLARLDPDAPPAPREAPLVELTAEDLAPVGADVEEPAEESPAEEEIVEDDAEEAEEPRSMGAPEFIPRPPRSRWRWVTPTALAATAVIAVSVTYRFALDEASRSALELRRDAPKQVAPSMAPLEPMVQAPRVEDQSVRGGFAPPPPPAKQEQDKASPPPAPPVHAEQAPVPAAPEPASQPPAPSAPAPIAPPASEGGKSALMAKEKVETKSDGFGADLARNEKPAPPEATRERKKSADEGVALGAAAIAEPQTASRAAAARAVVPPSVVVSSRSGNPVRWRFSGAKIERSEDARTWQPGATGLPSSAIAASAPSADVCWVVGQDGMVMRTSDGRSWQAIKSPTVDDLVHVQAWNESNATVKSAAGSRFSTSDGGATWSKL